MKEKLCVNLKISKESFRFRNLHCNSQLFHSLIYLMSKNATRKNQDFSRIFQILWLTCSQYNLTGKSCLLPTITSTWIDTESTLNPHSTIVNLRAPPLPQIISGQRSHQSSRLIPWRIKQVKSSASWWPAPKKRCLSGLQQQTTSNIHLWDLSHQWTTYSSIGTACLNHWQHRLTTRQDSPWEEMATTILMWIPLQILLLWEKRQRSRNSTLISLRWTVDGPSAIYALRLYLNNKMIANLCVL